MNGMFVCYFWREIIFSTSDAFCLIETWSWISFSFRSSASVFLGLGVAAFCTGVVDFSGVLGGCGDWDGCVGCGWLILLFVLLSLFSLSLVIPWLLLALNVQTLFSLFFSFLVSFCFLWCFKSKKSNFHL